jgi:hypothetical protein
MVRVSTGTGRTIDTNADGAVAMLKGSRSSGVRGSPG